MANRLAALFLVSVACYGSAVLAVECPTAPEVEVDPRISDQSVVGDWPGVIEHCVTPLETVGHGRWPIVLWESGPPEEWSIGAIRAAAARGIVPAIRLHPRWLPLAERLQAAELPVIVVEGKGSGFPPWPYHLVGPWPPAWNLQYEDGSEVPEAWHGLPVPSRLDGWAIAADGLRRVLTRFRLAGIRIDAFWMDYETQPSMLDYEAVRRAGNLDGLVPREAMADAAGFAGYRRQLWHQLVSTYVAAPIREAYPAAAVTNWLAVISVPDNPTLSWSGEPHPTTGPMLFTHTNPVAYGFDRGLVESMGPITMAFPNQTDWAYLSLLLRQVSADAANRQRVAPYLGSMAWVARRVTVLNDTPVPAMSRSMYREALRHLWLRDVDAMAVFNPERPGHAAYQVGEVQDAVAAYGEMLPFSRLLTGGEAFGLEVPAADRMEPFWSGMRDANGAIVRVFNPLNTETELELEVWPADTVKLTVPPGGTNFLIERATGGHTHIEVISSELPD